MLQSIDAEHTKRTVFRIATWEPIQPFVEDQGENPEHMNQLIEVLDDLPNYYRFNQPEQFERILLDSIFEPEEELKHFSRFCDGAFSVFYSALDKETAEAEVCYQHKKFFIRGSEDRRRVSRVLFSCEFSGSIKDLRTFVCPRPKQDDDHDDDGAVGYEFCTCDFSELARGRRSFVCPKLKQDEDVDDGYQFCQQLGREADQEQPGWVACTICAQS